jgi:cytosine/adenosine deaminase-related metal-dependent hydrolase
MREDIGRLAVGCKADLVLVDLSHPLMKPARDPLRSWIYYAADRVVRDVYVGGALVVKNGAVVTLDCPSSDDLRQFGCFRKGGSESSVIEIRRHAGDAANDDFRWSGV